MLDLAEEIERAGGPHLRSAPIPSRFDELVHAFTQRYARAAPALRRDLQPRMDDGFQWLLLAASERLAAWAVQQTDRSPLRSACIAISVPRELDWRETLLRLSLITDAAARLRVDDEQLFFESCSFLSEEEQAAFRTDWFSRDVSLKGIEGMGYEVRDDG
ncbi:MAG: hypothetical protein HY658_13740, partial [Actinobacteria bacterium]|nr:hypothetical protein [Actinomycetota bacterium]